MSKIWHKPLHKRKVWKEMTLSAKTIYCLKPFVIHFINTWLQPWPFPTLFKVIYSFYLILLMSIPIVFPIAIIITYYAIVQCLIESSLEISYPQKLDIVHSLLAVFQFKIENESYIEYMHLWLESCCHIASSFASCIDYIRMALIVMIN